MSTPTYPGDRNNEPNPNQEQSRDLALINQPAGGIEFRNVKDDEMVTIYHKNGSLLRFNKKSTDLLHTQDKREHIMGDSHLQVNGNVVEIFDKNVETISYGDSINKVGDVDKWQPYSEEYRKLIKEIHDIKRLFEIKRVKYHNFIDQAPEQTKDGSLAPCPIEKTKSKVLYTVAPMLYTPTPKAPCLRTIMTVADPIQEYKTVSGGGGKMFGSGWECFTCWGTGYSPSSQDGIWSEEKLKKEITQKRIDIQEKLFEVEKHLGQNKHREGGTQINKVSKDYVGVIGLAFNDFESFRRDPKGKLVPYGIKIDPFGSGLYTQYRESTLIEHVHVDRMPGGMVDLTISDSLSLIVGSNGINIKSTGPAEFYSPMFNIASEQFNLNSRGELTIGGERVDISGEIITIRPRKVEREIENAKGEIVDPLPANFKSKTEPEQQVFIDGNLNVGLNAIIKGGMHVEGEVSLLHITAPLEYQITETDFEFGNQKNCDLDPTVDNDCSEPSKSPTYADIVPGCLIGYCVVGSGSSAGTWPVFSICAPNSVLVHPHHHYFKNLPLKLIRDNIEVNMTVGDKTETKILDPHSVVRSIGSRNNFADTVNAKPVVNSTTNNTVHEKFGGSACKPLEISNGNWEEPNQNETFPPGEGVRTSSYPDSVIFEKVKELEKSLEEKYKELQKIIDQLSKNN